MKKLISCILALVLLAALLPAGARAEGSTVVLSAQGLRIDGKATDCEKYNIDGYNYFKLRDIALLLSRTGSRFSVRWEEETNRVHIGTGEAYVPDGSELAFAGGDKSASAVPSSQTLWIDGEERSDLEAWNIGGHNYFRLRSLGDALGFQVDYDEGSNTAILRTRAFYEPTQWLTQELIFTANNGEYHHEIYTYDGEGKPLSNFSEGVSQFPGRPEGVEYQTTNYFTYDELGRQTGIVTDHMNGGEKQLSSAFAYDVWGQLVRNDGGEENPGFQTVYAYDDRGNLVMMEQVLDTPLGKMTSGTYMEYDGNDHMLRQIRKQDDAILSHMEYAYDEEGNLLWEESLDGDGNRLYIKENVYSGGRMVRSTQDFGSYSVITTYDYDEASRTYTTVTESPSGKTTAVSTVDGEGRPLRQEWSDGGSSTVTVFAYDGEGRLVLQTTGDGEDPAARTSYTYDEEGNLLTEIYEESGGYREENVYDYDRAGARMTHTRTTTYPEASALVLFSGKLDMTVGQSSQIFFSFTPRNALAEAVTWTSSDEGVAKVDEGGVVTAVAAGSAVITATSLRGLTMDCTVIVTEAE